MSVTSLKSQEYHVYNKNRITRTPTREYTIEYLRKLNSRFALEHRYAYNRGIEFGFDCRAEALYIHDNSVEMNKNMGNYEASDIMKLKMEDNVIRWYKNDVEIHSVTKSGPMDESYKIFALIHNTETSCSETLTDISIVGESSISSSNSNGLKTVTIDANSVHDLVGNSNENDVVFNWNYHGTNISVTIESEDDDVNNGDVSNSNLVIVRGVRVRDGRA